MKRQILRMIGIIFIFILTTTRVCAINLAEAGDVVVQEGDYDSLRIVAGNKITNKANIDGLSLMAGNDILANGSSSYAFYAGNNIEIRENISKDLFVAGNKIMVYKDTMVGRDAFIVGNSVIIKSNLPRDLRIGANLVNLSGVTINGDAYLMASEIILDENTVIVGKLIYPEDANIRGLNLAKLGEVISTKKIETVIKYNFMDSVKDIVFSICASLIVMLVLFYVLPNTKTKLDNLNLKVDTILKTIGIGFLVLIVVPLVSIIGIFTNILTPIALILGCVYTIAIYLSTLLSSYIIGNTLMIKIFNKDSKYLALVMGIILIKLVKYIPVIGGVIYFICLLYGMGLIFNYIKLRDV